MSINKVPLYRKLYEQLRNMIEDGTYKTGDLLPSENELCAAHLLTRFTSRNFENKSLFELLRKHYQIHVKGGEQKIQAIDVTPKIQEQLNVNKNHPILQFDRKLETNRIGFYFYSQIYCNTKGQPLIGRF